MGELQLPQGSVHSRLPAKTLIYIYVINKSIILNYRQLPQAQRDQQQTLALLYQHKADEGGSSVYRWWIP